MANAGGDPISNPNCFLREKWPALSGPFFLAFSCWQLAFSYYVML